MLNPQGDAQAKSLLPFLLAALKAQGPELYGQDSYHLTNEVHMHCSFISVIKLYQHKSMPPVLEKNWAIGMVMSTFR